MERNTINDVASEEVESEEGGEPGSTEEDDRPREVADKVKLGECEATKEAVVVITP